MAGIAGAISNKPWNVGQTLGEMAQSLCHCSYTKVESWHDATAGVCRVRSGVDNLDTQPFFNHDKSKCIVLTGECYGSASLRKELINKGLTFKFCESDPELCLSLFEEKGVEGLRQLNGSFSFAILDLRIRELTLVSDRFASRPLFYAQTPSGKLLFSNQVSAILKEPEVPRDLNLHGIIELIGTQAVSGTKTLHRAVRMIPPASILLFKEGRCQLSTYWERSYEPEIKSDQSWAEELAEHIKVAVRQIMRGKHRFGLLLSGGLDSRMLLAAAESEVTCYTFGDYENMEYKAAQRVAQAKGFESVFVQRREHHYADMVDPAVEIGGGMYAFNHAHAIGFMEELHNDCDVMLHGFATEPYFRDTKLPVLQRKFMGLKGKKILNRNLKEEDLPARLFWRHFSLLPLGPKQLFTNQYRAMFDEALVQSAQELLNEADLYCTKVHEKYGWPETHYYSKNPPFLFALSIRPYMTERNFICDNGLLDLHFRMPVTVRLNSHVWIQAMKILDPQLAALPDANTGFNATFPSLAFSLISSARATFSTKTLIPNWIPGAWRMRSLFKSKSHMKSAHLGSRGSYPNFDSLIRRDDCLKSLIIDTLTDPECLDPEIFNIDRINQLFEEHIQGRANHRYFLFILLSFGRWHKKYGPH